MSTWTELALVSIREQQDVCDGCRRRVRENMTASEAARDAVGEFYNRLWERLEYAEAYLCRRQARVAQANGALFS